MARKKKDLPLLSGVEIQDVAAEGNSIARVDEMVVFIPFGAPGDIADVKIDRKKRSYAEGHIERLTQPSQYESRQNANTSLYAEGADGSICHMNSSSNASKSRLRTLFSA